MLDDIRRAFRFLRFRHVPFLGPRIKRKLVKKALEYEAKVLRVENARELIRGAGKLAVGERVCRCVFKTHTPFTESIFLDGLAEAMVHAGKAHFVTEEVALETLLKYPKHPIVLSKVSGHHVEICRSVPAKCIYWNLEKRGMRVLERIGNKREK